MHKFARICTIIAPARQAILIIELLFLDLTLFANYFERKRERGDKMEWLLRRAPSRREINSSLAIPRSLHRFKLRVGIRYNVVWRRDANEAVSIAVTT